ncbi:hypothetical protein PHMEG_00036124 [Phytophthora megakarya]|uniref:Uncharacterized protein n=1 Tax=Phytophthora megakarya TaxID=4795 RepID=A0A225UMI7_9STRA|nr:hypothetical protein PHMEG_00036124 [Phytophthora megakarya]
MCRGIAKTPTCCISAVYPNAVPPFLKSASARLSYYTYNLVRKELTILFYEMKDAGFTKIGIHQWEVFTNFSVYTCDGEIWKCSCLFFVVPDYLVAILCWLLGIVSNSITYRTKLFYNDGA